MKKPRAVPRSAIKALRYLSEHHAEIVTHGGKVYVLAGDKALHLPDKTFNALASAGWVTPLQKIDDDHSKCIISEKGRKKLKAIQEAGSGYVQNRLFQEEEAAAAAAIPAQVPMFASLAAAPDDKTFVERVGSRAPRAR